MDSGAEVQPLLGSAVKKLRADAGVTQEELSNRTGVHTTYISDVERGARNPSWATLVKLAEGLGVSMSEFGAAFDQVSRPGWRHDDEPTLRG